MTTSGARLYFADNRAQEGHGQRSVRAGAVSIAARVVNAVVQVGSVIFLARLLSPEDYGLVSMVVAVTGFAPVLVDFGTRDAIVQRSHIAKGEISAIFWITLGIGAGMTLAVAACGQLIAAFYGDPRLNSIVLVSSVTFVMAALSCQHHALMRRAMMFRQLATIELLASISSAGTAVAMAYFHWNYWALVSRPIVQYGLTAVGVWSQCRWLPGAPRMTPSVKVMLGFGGNVLGFSMVDFLAKNMDRIGIGSRSGARLLGYYQSALLVYDNTLDLTFPLHNVAVASLSKLQSDVTSLRTLWAKALSTLAFYGMPAFGILSVTGQDTIVLLLGEKWSSASLLLSVLALRGPAHLVERTLGWLHVTAGRPDRWMRWGIFATCIQAIALFSGLPFGPIGVVLAYVLSTYLLFVPALAYAGRPIGIGAADVISAVGRPLIGTLLAAGVGFILRETILNKSDLVLNVFLLSAAYVSIYVILVAGILKVRSPIRVLHTLVSDVLLASKLSLLRAIYLCPSKRV